ncbi:type VI secretion system Vgr family protein [Stenotrophomonas sepilia]|uniref:type VI secretion system Vgr family protein n=1 Tax=Stenotrophomonas sepilia TaxID=2860290 RepID=UPI003341D415
MGHDLQGAWHAHPVRFALHLRRRRHRLRGRVLHPRRRPVRDLPPDPGAGQLRRRHRLRPGPGPARPLHPLARRAARASRLGLVCVFEQGDTGFRRTRYRAVVEPPLARLALGSDWRIFQQRSVPQILQALLAEHGIEHYAQNLTEEHLPREYCVQAGDTDLDFLLRLAAEEGLFHRFVHDDQGVRLIHGDRLYIHGIIDGGPVRYNPTPGGDAPEPALRRFTYTEQVRTARQTQRDYTFKHPRYEQQHSLAGEGLARQARDYERYDYPGRYKRDAAGSPFTRDRLRGLRGDARIAVVEGDDARLVPGVAFDLQGHPMVEALSPFGPCRGA